MLHIASLETIAVYSLLSAYINVSNLVQIAALYQNKALIEVLPKYVNYTDIFLFDLVIELLENRNINKYAIELQKSKQPEYRQIYSLGPVKLEILKTYIKTHLKTTFIWPSKSPTSTLILFDKMLNDSFCLCVYYWALNNLTMKN